ncbi:hypothetical protein B0H11DRAFT_1919815 [Mycena galericulata]|nr:hypothetical protein B0H11DRAFT_1919815 [Mycena galericulata]
MCFLISTDLFCPCCGKHHPSTISLLRCSTRHAGCIDWNAAYLHIFRRFTRETVCYVSADSAQPYRDFVSITRPCKDCAVQLIRGARLVAFENSVAGLTPASKYVSPPESVAAMHVTKPLDYVAKTGRGYVDRRTCPIFMSAVFSSGGLPMLSYDQRLSRYVAGFVSDGDPQQYDAMEYLHWSWEFSPGSLYHGAAFNHIPPLPPSSHRIQPRHYDSITQLWAHPFTGRIAERALAVQRAPLTGREISEVLRSYTINGEACDRSISFLAPDCFAPTLWTATEIKARVWEFAARAADSKEFKTTDGRMYYMDRDGVYRRPALDRIIVLRRDLLFKSLFIL